MILQKTYFEIADGWHEGARDDGSEEARALGKSAASRKSTEMGIAMVFQGQKCLMNPPWLRLDCFFSISH